jgi:hypothetical protein
MPVLTGIASPASAAMFFTNGAGLVSPASTLTFSELAFADNTLITNEFASFGVTFNNAVFNPQDGYMPRNYVGNYQLSTIQYPDLSLTFGTAVSDAAFELATNPGNSVINLYLGATLVDTASLATSNGAGSFYGYTGGLFDRIQILAPVNGALLVDNIQFNAATVAGAVPEPATWIMMLAGFGVVAAGMRFNRRSARVSYS